MIYPTDISVGFALGNQKEFNESIYALAECLLAKKKILHGAYDKDEEYILVSDMKAIFAEGGFIIGENKNV